MIQEGARVHDFRTPVRNVPPLVRDHLQILILPVTPPADHESYSLPYRRPGGIPQSRHVDVALHPRVEVEVLVVLRVRSHLAYVLDDDRRTILVYLPEESPELVRGLRQ